MIDKLLTSFQDDKGRYMARKMSAFAGVVTAIVVTFVKLPADMVIHALYAWLVFALLCLGIVTAEQVLKFKNGEKKDEPTA